MRPRISIRGSVRRSVGPSVRLAFFFKSRKSRGNDIESLENKIWQIWLINLTNLTNLSDKSILVPNFRRIFVRTNLFLVLPLFPFPFFFLLHVQYQSISNNKFVRTKICLKLGTKIDLSERFVRFVRLICQIWQILFSSDSMSLS